MSRSILSPIPGTIAAFALVAAGLTGTIVDNDGTAGLALFIAGAAGALFLIGQVARSLAPRLHRPHLPARRFPTLLRGRTIAAAVVAMGVLLSVTNVFKATDDDGLSRAVNYGAWYGFLLLAVTLVAVAVTTIARWIAKPKVADG